jgi:hypothetical protein
MSYRGPAAIAALIALISLPAAAQTVTEYRFSPDTISGDDVLTHEIPAGDLGAGFRVTRDASGRMTKAEIRRAGKTTETLVYHYSPGSLLPSGYDDYSAAIELTGRVSITRDATGFETRLDYETPGGAFTHYVVRQLLGTDVDYQRFSREGKRTSHSIRTFAASGYDVRKVDLINDSTSYDSVIEEATGLVLSRHKVLSNRIVLTTRYVYNDGDLISEGLYDTRDSWYGGRDYTDGLLRIERYKFGSHTQESRYTYDSNEWATAVTFFRDDVLICTFKYTRLPDATIAKTVAVGPNGDLFAEYPDLFVASVEQGGRPVDHPEAGVIYKTGLWW